MKHCYLVFVLVVLTGCASTSPILINYDLNQDEKRLLRVQVIQNKTGKAEYDKMMDAITGKFIDNIERSGKYTVVDARKTIDDPRFKPDSEAIASITGISYNVDCLFGLLAWIDTPTAEADMHVRIIDIDTREILSTASVSEKAWTEEWIALFIFKLGTRKSQSQLESLAIDYTLKALTNKL